MRVKGQECSNYIYIVPLLLQEQILLGEHQNKKKLSHSFAYTHNILVGFAYTRLPASRFSSNTTMHIEQHVYLAANDPNMMVEASRGEVSVSLRNDHRESRGPGL